MSLINGDLYDLWNDDEGNPIDPYADDEDDDDGNPANGTIVSAAPGDVRRWTLIALNPPWVDDVIDKILRDSDTRR